MTRKLLLLPGDGIGPEIMQAIQNVINALCRKFDHQFDIETALIGGAAIDEYQNPLPENTVKLAKEADVVLLGAVGGPKWDNIERDSRPETGLLRIRAELDAFANLRPAITYPELAKASSLKTELVAGLDILIVRELTGGIYFGQPRELDREKHRAFNTMVYSETEIQRIGKIAFTLAQKRKKQLCSVDKANVLEVSQLWRETMTELSKDYNGIKLSHMYVDNAAMQLIKEPKQFDVIVTGNLFGDILSDAAAMLTGSIGMLPSASLNEFNKGLYEPVHGSAPDIAGTNKANPLAMILSFGMALRYSLDLPQMADAIETAVKSVLQQGYRTLDIAEEGMQIVGTKEMGEQVAHNL